jgi:hypothetical protein
MYLHIMSEDEQQQVIRALRGPQFVRERHGSLYDRGVSDSYYGRQITPHYGGTGGASGPRVEVTDADSIVEYLAGYDWNETYGGKKEYG